MLVRLGRVIYWACAAVAVLIGGLGTALAVASPGNPTEALIVVWFLAGIAAVAGVATRYVISGETIAADFRRTSAQEAWRASLADERHRLTESREVPLVLGRRRP